MAFNPIGEDPTIQHNGKVITERAAICAYLADSFPDASLTPPFNPYTDYHQWLFFAAGPVESAVTNKSLNLSTTGQETMTGYGSFDDVYKTLTGAVSKTPYICATEIDDAAMAERGGQTP